jgi:hypothetical protein
MSLQKCSDQSRLNSSSIEIGRSIGLSLVVILISSSFCILTAIRDLSADAERVNASAQKHKMPGLRTIQEAEVNSCLESRKELTRSGSCEKRRTGDKMTGGERVEVAIRATRLQPSPKL